jgi:hypothetical protein
MSIAHQKPPWWVWFEPPQWWPRWLHEATCTFCRHGRKWVKEQARG